MILRILKNNKKGMKLISSLKVTYLIIPTIAVVKTIKQYLLVALEYSTQYQFHQYLPDCNRAS